MKRRVLLSYLAVLLLASMPHEAFANDKDSTTVKNIQNRIETRVADVLNPHQLQELLDGADPADLTLATRMNLETFIERVALGTDFEIVRFGLAPAADLGPVDGFQLTGTFGQPEAAANTLSGGTFSLQGGFWNMISFAPGIFSSGFETGDLSEWSASTGN